MGILALIISILKIIGIILLIILALILLILIILLFSSIKFETIAKINKEIKFIVNIKYLFGIIKYKYDYEKNESLLKIFGKKINFNEEKELDYELKEDLEEFEEDIEKNIEKRDNNLEKDNYNKSKKKFDIEKENSLKDEENEYKEKTKKKSNKRKNFDFINTLKQIYKDNKDILKIFKKLINRLIKAIKIKKIKIDFEYGLYEPYETGKLCGIISIILPIFPKKYLKKIKLIPNFEEEKFIGDTYIKLKTNLFKILLPILIFILKKPIRKIIFGKGE